MGVWQFSRSGRGRVRVLRVPRLGFSELINAGRSVTTGSNFSLMNHEAPSTNFRDPLLVRPSSLLRFDIFYQRYNICIADDKSAICCVSSSREKESSSLFPPPPFFPLSLFLFRIFQRIISRIFEFVTSNVA